MITPEEMERERIKSLKLLENNFEMYENSKKDILRKLKQKMLPNGQPFYTEDQIDKQMKLIQSMEDDIVEKYTQQGGDPENLEKIRGKRRISPDKKEEFTKVYNKQGVIDIVNEYLSQKSADSSSKANVKRNNEPVEVEPARKTIPSTPVKVVQKDSPIQIDEAVKSVSSMMARNAESKHIEPAAEVSNSLWKTESNGNGVFDVIPLPSKGECYPNKVSKIPVSFLTAYDENMLVSPNLYRDGLVLDYIIRNKVREDAGINPDNLVTGDRDAIILWLRATGYGNDFPITVTDRETGKNFETTVDLSKINFKEFNLVGDEHGWFEFAAPVSGDLIKFRFLTARDNRRLEEIENDEAKKTALTRLREVVSDIDLFLKDNKNLTKEEKTKIFEAQNTLSDWSDKMETEETEELPFTNTITNRMEIMIMEVNGERDREFIHNYVNNMNVRDSSAFRRFVAENEPGLDFNLTVERPESLGGGSMPVFLELDQTLFLNIA